MMTGSNPAGRSRNKRVSFNGRMFGFHPNDVGSIPITRSKMYGARRYESGEVGGCLGLAWRVIKNYGVRVEGTGLSF